MATDENNHKNEARDDWTGCTFRVERGPSSEGRAYGMADILTDACGGATFRPRRSPRRPHRRDRDPTRVTLVNWSNARASAAVGARDRPSSTSRAGKDDMAPVFGEGGNLPSTRLTSLRCR